MRITTFLKISGFLFLTHTSYVLAQMPGTAQVAVAGWIDETHVIVRTYDNIENPVYSSVDVRSGRSRKIIHLKTQRETLLESLPAGIRVTAADAISPDYKSVVITRDNDLYLYKASDGTPIRLTNDSAQEVNPRFSPDGTKIAYTRNKDLFVFDITANHEIRITHDAGERIYNGYASWVYMEEILGRSGRYAAFWWSPDGKHIAYLRTDETEVPVFTLNRLDVADGIHGTLEITPYPKPGDPNPRVKMGIADVATAKTTWVKTDNSADQYIAWPFWTPDGKKLAIQIVNRDQNDLSIILADPSTGDFSLIYNEKYKTWLDFHEDIHVMSDGTGFIIKSYKNGWDNLYYHGWDGRLISQITNFDFRVTSVNRVDEDEKKVYFSATGPESTHTHFFSVNLDGKNLIQITKGDGTHVVSISPEGNYFVDTWSSFHSPGSIVAYDRKGIQISEIRKLEQSGEQALPKIEYVRIKTSDGLFDLPATIIYPLGFEPSEKYPVVFTIYGGPDSKNIYNKWPGKNVSWYAKNNIVQFRVDHRGSGHFGKRGNDYLYRSLGKWEILDYMDAVKWLRHQPWIDTTKVGITGSSYGGYMTCLALTRGAGFWTHGFAGSSVTDWKLYDNVYTERFMDTPADNPEGYRDGSAITYVGDYKGKLYITHGDMDDNVHLQNSIYLISKLQDEGKTFSFMLYPGGRHGWSGPKAAHLRNEEYNFWLTSFFGR